jgi:acyl carrier protein
MSSDASTQDILPTLFGFLERFPTKSGPLSAQTDLVADLNLDSVSLMELLVEIEDHYDISLPLNAMADVETVQDLADKIATLTEDKA